MKTQFIVGKIEVIWNSHLFFSSKSHMSAAVEITTLFIISPCPLKAI